MKHLNEHRQGKGQRDAGACNIPITQLEATPLIEESRIEILPVLDVRLWLRSQLWVSIRLSTCYVQIASYDQSPSLLLKLYALLLHGFVESELSIVACTCGLAGFGVLVKVCGAIDAVDVPD